MKITNLKKLKPKKLIVFDLDDTLADSKTPMDAEMADLVKQLLEKTKIAVIGGGKYQIFKWQFIRHLAKGTKKEKLFIFPTSGNAFYKYDNGWKIQYAHFLSSEEKKQIRDAFDRAYEEIGYRHPKKVYGVILEDRLTQISWSPLGQDIVTVLGKKGLKLKKDWRDKYDPVRHRISKLVRKYLPHLGVRVGGITTIDVTMKGRDKAYGVMQMQKHLKTKVKDMLYVGDSIFPGGNDYSVLKTGIDYIKVTGHEDTKKIIRELIK
jgi:HAD superfamily hydrolase (TIGR01484 family)